jgi:hypothetical protein
MKKKKQTEKRMKQLKNNQRFLELVKKLNNNAITDCERKKLKNKMFQEDIKNIRENIRFSDKNKEMKSIIEKVAELSVDFLKYDNFTKKNHEKFASGNWALWAYMNYVFTPYSHEICTNFIVGNFHTCFLQLRFILEALVKFYLADSKYPSHLYFQQKLELLELEYGRNTKQIMEDVEKISQKEGIYSLWKNLCKFVHPGKNNIPGCVIGPGEIYIKERKTLKKEIDKFREINNHIIALWQAYIK